MRESTGKRRDKWLARTGKPVPCPHCGSGQTERFGVFGPFHISEPYICKECHSPFQRVKWEPPAPAPK